MDTGNKSVDTISIFLLPNRATRLPETGNPLIDPTGNANNTEPKAALLICNCDCISGILLAQLANRSPDKKKKNANAIRFFPNAEVGNNCMV